VNVESGEAKRRIKTIALDRSQLKWAEFDLDSLIDEAHPARAIWELCGRFDLTRFESQQKTVQGQAGRPCWSARLLASIWIYSYSIGVASARAIERMLAHEPGLRWLAADERINYHTLADFRVGNKEGLDDVFSQLLALLETGGFIDLKQILHDGTKVKSRAAKASLHRKKALQHRVREARRVVRKLDEQAAANEGMDERRRAARERAAREGLSRAEAALKKLKELEAQTAPSKRSELRVSVSEPEARKMKHADGSYAPSYNVQVSTEAKSRVVVAVGVTEDFNDLQQLTPALERVEATSGRRPEQLIADTGYATRANVEETTRRNVELIAPWKNDESREAGACTRNGIDRAFWPSRFRSQRGGKKLTCPAGKTLVWIKQRTEHETLLNVFEAAASDCRRCAYRRKCCGERTGPRQVARVVETDAMKQYLARMKRPEQRALYRKRSEIAEFPHLWAKAVKGWRQFSVRGLVKAGMEAVWVMLAYNVAQWMRLREPAAAAA
jgi:transposase